MGTRELDQEQLSALVTLLSARVGDMPLDAQDTEHAAYMAAYMRVHARHAAAAPTHSAFLRLTTGQLDALADWLEDLVRRRTLKPV